MYTFSNNLIKEIGNFSLILIISLEEFVGIKLSLFYAQMNT